MGEVRRCWLRWHNYSDSVTSALESLRYDEDFLDVTLACQGHTIRAHKLVLSASSAYFRKVLKDHPCEHPIIMLEGLGWREVGWLLHFMYCGQVVVEETHLPALLNAAAALSVTGLAHVTSALASTQVSRSEDSEDEDFDEEDIDEEENDKYEKENTNESDKQQQQQQQQQHVSKKREVERESSEGDSSYDSDVPPAKRLCSESLVDNVEKKKRKVIMTQDDSSINGTCGSKKGKVEPLSSSLNNVIPDLINNTNNSNNTQITPTTLTSSNSNRPEAPHTPTPTPTIPPPSSDSSDKENEKTPGSGGVKSPEECSSSGSDKLLINGDKHVKEEIEVDSFAEALGSCGVGENGDSDTFKTTTTTTTLSFDSDKDGEDSDGNMMGAAAPLHPLSYVSFLSASSILGTQQTHSDNITNQTSTTSASNILLPPSGLSSIGNGSNSSNNNNNNNNNSININKVVQQVLMPNTITLQRDTGIIDTDTTTTTSTAMNPYIHPSLVSGKEVQATLEQYQRKLAFHEPRPCPTCNRMYRDAATLRTHMAIMHAEAKEPFSCTCGALFRTKYDMYQHKKNGHR